MPSLADGLAVPTKSRPSLTSKAGQVQTLPPPSSGLLWDLGQFPLPVGVSVGPQTRKVCQSCLPVFASKASTWPRADLAAGDADVDDAFEIGGDGRALEFGLAERHFFFPHFFAGRGVDRDQLAGVVLDVDLAAAEADPLYAGGRLGAFFGG